MLRIGKLIGAVALVAGSAAAITVAPPAAASAATFCDELAGQWDGQTCHTSVTSDRKAVRDIKLALPGDLVENPVIRQYLTNLMNNWRNAAQKMAADSFGEEQF